MSSVATVGSYWIGACVVAVSGESSTSNNCSSGVAVRVLADSDGDGLADEDELNLRGSDPNDPDTDGDGASDGAEIAAGRDPTINEAAALGAIFRIILGD